MHRFALVSTLAIAGALSGADVPSVEAVRIDRSNRPQIDGDLSDAVWSRASAIDGFRQVDPVEGATPSERTTVRIAFDEDALYIAIDASDRSAPAVVATVMARDGNIRDDDHVLVMLDPFGTGRDGYAFGINPTGSRWDALVENNLRLIETWDAIWRGEARVTPSGWAAEMAIPFRSISWSSSENDWGLQIIRTIQRTKETIRWSSISQSLAAEDLSRIGALRGIRQIERGRRIDVNAFLRSGLRRSGAPARTESVIEPSANIFYRVTPSLTGTVTFNTDFSDAPLDERRVNTGRFPLFFPETRDFFLQDAAVFEFGGRLFGDDPNGLPFFSRRIGIAGRELVDIVAGSKLSGRVGRTSVGALTVRTDPESIDGQTLSVVRLSTPVLDDTSKVGVIATDGDPLGRESNRTVGADGQYRQTVFGNLALVADAFYLRSFSAGETDDAFGAAIAYPNDRTQWDVTAKQIGRDFSPALGFVSRPAVRTLVGNYRYRHRPERGALRWWQWMSWNELAASLDNTLESRTNGMTFWVLRHGGDQALLEAWESFELVPEAFNVAGRVPIPAGKYTWQRANTVWRTSPSRRLSGSVGVSCCAFYDGTSFDASLTAAWRPTRHLAAVGRFSRRDIELPRGAVTIDIASVEGNVNFTPDMRLALQAQHDNISRELGVSLRFLWEVIPGSEVLVVLGDSSLEGEHGFRSLERQASVRVGHTFRW